MSLPETAPLDLSAAVPLASFSLNLLLPGSSTPSGWIVELAGPMHPSTIEVNNLAAREQIAKEGAIEFAQVNGRKYKVEDEPI